MGGKNLALYTLKPNVAVSISGRLNTCRVLNFKVQAVSCTVSLMQGCNHTGIVRPTAVWWERNGRSLALYRCKVISPFLALTTVARCPHTLLFSMQWPLAGDNLKYVEINGGFSLQRWLVAFGGNTAAQLQQSPLCWSTTRPRYTFRLAAAAHGGTVQRITAERGALQLQGAGSSFWNHCRPTAPRGELSTALPHPAPRSLFPKLPSYLFQLGVGTEQTQV